MDGRRLRAIGERRTLATKENRERIKRTECRVQICIVVKYESAKLI
jgi:hypothetical protein